MNWLSINQLRGSTYCTTNNSLSPRVPVVPPLRNPNQRIPGNLCDAHEPLQPATLQAMSGHRTSLAHVPAGQLLGDVEGLPHESVIEVGGGGCGVGAGGIQVHRNPRTQQFLGGRRSVRVFASLPGPSPPRGEEGQALHTWCHIRLTGRRVKMLPKSWTMTVSFSDLQVKWGRGCLSRHMGLRLAWWAPGQAYLKWPGTPPAHGAYRL